MSEDFLINNLKNKLRKKRGLDSLSEKLVLAQAQGRAGTPTPQREPHLPPLGPPACQVQVQVQA